MIQNTFTVKIDGIDVTPFCIIPLKIGNFLDEQLDEVPLSLRHIPIDIIKPLSLVEIHIENSFLFDGVSRNRESKALQMIVADDGNAQESPIGSGLYNHDLTLIEITKLAELFIVDTNTITNDLGRVYTGNPKTTVPYIQASPAMEKLIYKPEYYKSPINLSSTITLLPCERTEGSDTNGIIPYRENPIGLNEVYEFTIKIYNPNGVEAEQKFTRNSAGATTGSNAGFVNYQFKTSALYTVEYRFHIEPPLDPAYPSSDDVIVSFPFAAISNEYPLKKWTITDVVNRLCDIVEPLQKGEIPRFYLNEKQAEKFNNVYAPQFSFTKSTFRECLQQCGKIIHAEPRLLKIGTRYQIYFDEYGRTEFSKIAENPYNLYSVKQNIESYATDVDSNAENLVNTKEFGKVLIEPYSNGYKTVRTETLYTRIEETNMIIETQYPIYTVEKLECGIIKADKPMQPIDITDYLFESSVYTTRLSSYADLYPFSKGYGIMYTQGQKSVRALSFKQENPISPVFENYAILNILRSATGDDSLTLSSADGEYLKLAFRVTYTPFYNARIGQTKVNYQDYPNHATIIYNQQDNVIETQNYGENIKGVIARIGNAEKTYTFNLARFSDIPKAGDLFNDDYYISSVITEILPTVIKCTVSLSKDFNRLSQYIGISSIKRFSEIAQNQAVERNTLWKEYIVVGDDTERTEDDLKCLTKPSFMLYLMAQFYNTQEAKNTYKPITSVIASGKTFNGSQLNKVILPVVSSAFGNSMSYSWKYADNYSAGNKSTYRENDNVKGFFQDGVPYTDYYGQIHYYNFDLNVDGKTPTNYNEQTGIGMMLPDGEMQIPSRTFIGTQKSETEETPILLRKDNREILQCNFQLDFVSNQKGLIIGSALAGYNPSIRESNQDIALYVFPERLNKFINHVTGQIEIPDAFWENSLYNVVMPQYTDDSKYNLQFKNNQNGNVFLQSGLSWAICTKQTTQERTVQDVYGNVVTEKVQYGGDVLLAKNEVITSGSTSLPNIHFTIKRKIFNK